MLKYCRLIFRERIKQCAFCEIINGNIPSTKVYEDDMMVAFKDLNRCSRSHSLCSQGHIESVNAITAENSKYVAHILKNS
ncbi:MAG: hypothetical protein ACLR6O_02885 [Eubacterium sp.]